MVAAPALPTHLGARAAAAVSAVVWGVFFFGLIDLAVAIEQTEGFYDSYLLETGWGLLFTFLVAAPFLSLSFRPRVTAPLVQVVLVAAAIAVTALASGSWGQLVPAGLLVLNVALVAGLVPRLAGPGRSRRRPRLEPVLTVLVVVLTPAALAYAVDMVAGYRTGRPPTDDDTWNIDHWPMQAALAVAVVVVALGVAAGVREQRPGTAVCAGCVAISACWFGVTCVVYPDHAGSVGTTWGVLVAVWGGIFALATGWRMLRRRTPPGTGA